jgi:hypothetical protein
MIGDEFFSGSGIWDLFESLTMTKAKTLILEAYEARKKVSLHSTFHVGSGSGMKKCFIPNPDRG